MPQKVFSVSMSFWSEASVIGLFLFLMLAVIVTTPPWSLIWSASMKWQESHRSAFGKRDTWQQRRHRYQHKQYSSILFSIASHFDFHECIPVGALKLNKYVHNWDMWRQKHLRVQTTTWKHHISRRSLVAMGQSTQPLTHNSLLSFVTRCQQTAPALERAQLPTVQPARPMGRRAHCTLPVRAPSCPGTVFSQERSQNLGSLNYSLQRLSTYKMLSDLL